jgi:hypothetical protein
MPSVNPSILIGYFADDTMLSEWNAGDRKYVHPINVSHKPRKGTLYVGINNAKQSIAALATMDGPCETITHTTYSPKYAEFNKFRVPIKEPVLVDIPFDVVKDVCGVPSTEKIFSNIFTHRNPDRLRTFKEPEYKGPSAKVLEKYTEFVHNIYKTELARLRPSPVPVTFSKEDLTKLALQMSRSSLTCDISSLDYRIAKLLGCDMSFAHPSTHEICISALESLMKERASKITMLESINKVLDA